MRQEDLDNTERKRLRRTTYLLIFLLLSVLIHSLIMTAFFHFSFTHHRTINRLSDFIPFIMLSEPDKTTHSAAKNKQNKVLQALRALKEPLKKEKFINNLPAKLRAPKSNFGWTIFEDTPSQVKQPRPQRCEIPTNLDGPVGEASITQATEGKPGPVIKKAVTPAAVKEVAPILAKQKITAVTPAATTAAPAQPPQQTISQPVASITQANGKQPIPELSGRDHTTSEPTSAQGVDNGQKSVEDRIAAIRTLQEKLESFQDGRIPQTASTPATTAPTTAIGSATEDGEAAEGGQQGDRIVGGPGGIRVRGARSINGKGRRNIIALTKGFVEKLDGEEGTDLIDRDGDPNKRPSFEELKYLSYEAKINWCLQATWKQNFSTRPAARPLEGQAIIEFTIDEHGNVTQTALLQSSGIAELDAMIMKNTKFASPFPPLPHHFETKTYTTGRIITVTSAKTNF